MKNHYAILYSPGPNWKSGKSIYDQDLFEHGKFMQSLFEEGRLVIAGPFSDSSGGQAVVRAETLEEAGEIRDRDPAIRNGVFRADIHPWHVVFKAKNEQELRLISG